MKKLCNLLFLFFFSFSAVWVNASPVAMVMDLMGKVQVNGAQTELLAELEDKSSISLEKDASVLVVFLSSGEEYKLQGPATATIEGNSLKSSHPAQKSQTILASVENIDNSNFGQAAIVMRSGSSGAQEKMIDMIYPKSSKILSSSPKLKWLGLGTGYDYRVEVLSEAGDSLYSAETNKTFVQIPDTIVLPRGELLSWEIEAVKGKSILYNIADFFIANKDEVSQVEKSRPADNASFSQKLMFAWSVEKRGLNHEAQKYWQILAKLRPNDAVIQSKLK